MNAQTLVNNLQALVNKSTNGFSRETSKEIYKNCMLLIKEAKPFVNHGYPITVNVESEDESSSEEENSEEEYSESSLPNYECEECEGAFYEDEVDFCKACRTNFCIKECFEKESRYCSECKNISGCAFCCHYQACKGCGVDICKSCNKSKKGTLCSFCV